MTATAAAVVAEPAGRPQPTFALHQLLASYLYGAHLDPLTEESPRIVDIEHGDQEGTLWLHIQWWAPLGSDASPDGGPQTLRVPVVVAANASTQVPDPAPAPDVEPELVAEPEPEPVPMPVDDHG